MKVSDIVADCIVNLGVDTVFGISGGASLHILNSINENRRLKLVSMQHEQSAAMAADGYSRTSKNLGVAVTTSGPGATNLMTGIAGCFYDSIPCLFITGQVSTNRQTKGTGVRQTGFQETPISDMVKTITKYTVTISDAGQVQEEIYKAAAIAMSGRPGPVLVDIPDDIQRMLIRFTPNSKLRDSLPVYNQNFVFNNWEQFKTLLEDSKKPVIVLGWGVHLSCRESELLQLLDRIQVPTLLTWGAKDIIPAERKYLIGAFGTHGERFANHIIQKSDLIISIGSRLDLKSTGSPQSWFAPRAKKIMIDIDRFELEKFNPESIRIDLAINCDLREDLFDRILEVIGENEFQLGEWYEEINSTLIAMPIELRKTDINFVNPYGFLNELSEQTLEGTRIFVDTGCAIAWTMQSWKVKPSQRIFHDLNNTAMGWAIPASIGSLYQNEGIRTICIVGDGSLMMTLSELATLKHSKKVLKIFLLNNGGYSMIKQTQDQWFGSNYFASNDKEDFTFPNFQTISAAFGIEYVSLKFDFESVSIISTVLASKTSVICEVFIDPSARVIPQVKFGESLLFLHP
jgi:acetolactate synthase-1/2/3 large subunit